MLTGIIALKHVRGYVTHVPPERRVAHSMRAAHDILTDSDRPVASTPPRPRLAWRNSCPRAC